MGENSFASNSFAYWKFLKISWQFHAYYSCAWLNTNPRVYLQNQGQTWYLKNQQTKTKNFGTKKNREGKKNRSNPIRRGVGISWQKLNCVYNYTILMHTEIFNSLSTICNNVDVIRRKLNLIVTYTI
jgi:hypothetical protein